MKKFKVFLLGVLLVAFGSCEKAEDGKNNVPKVVSIESNEETDTTIFSLSYPQIEGKETEDFKYFNSIMKENMQLMKESYKEPASESNSDIKNEISVDYSVVENNFNILSIVVSTETYTGGAHGAHSSTAYNFSLKDNKLLKLSDIITKDGIEYINMKINDEISKDTEGIYFAEAVADINNATVYFSEDKLIAIFSEYDIAPYSSGRPEFEFNKAEIEKYLIKK